MTAPSSGGSRPVIFVHSGSEAETPARLAALASAMTARGRSSQVLPAARSGSVRSSTVIFSGDFGSYPLWRSRMAGNATLLDVRGSRTSSSFPGAARLLDGAIFRSRAQQRALDRSRWTSRVIYDEPEPGLVPHQLAEGEFRVACFGVGAAGEHFGRLRGVAFIDSHPLRHASQFNCHLSLRLPGAAELLRAGGEVANAAACGAVLVTMRDAAATELLGDDYPFYCSGDAAAISAAIARAREARGGPLWKAALARLREAGAKTALEQAVDGHLEHCAAVERARKSPAASLPPPGATAAPG